MIRAAIEQGQKISVFADETRPFLQGARLTAWELMKDKIPTTVICDNMAAALMRQGRIQAVIVGADRIAANGDVANKIGTYGRCGAGARTRDSVLRCGAVVHDRPCDEPRRPDPDRAARPRRGDAHQRQADDAHGVGIENPAFDVTPAKYVTAIVTERGVLRAPYAESVRAMAIDPPPPAERVPA